VSSPANTDFGQVGERIGELLGGLADSGDDKALYAAEESVRLLVELYGKGSRASSRRWQKPATGWPGCASSPTTAWSPAC